MVVDVQLYAGRSLDTVTQAETIGPYARRICEDYGLYTAGAAMLETAERLVADEREPAVQQYWLLAGALRALSEHAHAPGLVLDSYLLRALAVAGWAPSFVDCARCGEPGPHHAFAVAQGGAVCSRCRPPGSTAPAPRPSPCSPRCSRGVGRGRRVGRPAPQGSERPRGRLQPIPPGENVAITAHGGAGRPRSARPRRPARRRGRCLRGPARRCRGGRLMARRTYQPPFPHPSGARPRRSRRSSCRTTWPSSWTATAAGPTRAGCRAPRVTRPARRRCSTSSRARSRSASSTCPRTRSRPRTGSARPTRSASSWASTATSSGVAATRWTRGACACGGRGAVRGCGRP